MTVNILADRMAQTRTAEANKQLCICTCHTASRSRRRCRIQQMRFARMPQTNNLQSDLRVGGSVIRAVHDPEASVAQSADDLVVVGIVLVLDRHLGVNLNTKRHTSNRMHIEISNTICSYFSRFNIKNSIAISVLPQRHYVSQAVLRNYTLITHPHTPTQTHSRTHSGTQMCT
jgi:hypothetical protein